jgi:hypothetical protein
VAAAVKKSASPSLVITVTWDVAVVAAVVGVLDVVAIPGVEEEEEERVSRSSS